MNKLITELQRLYFLPDLQSKEFSGVEDDRLPDGDSTAPRYQLVTDLRLLGDDGLVRAMVLDFRRASDWPAVAALFQALQDDLELPAPAISVSGEAGFKMWFSLVDSLPLAEALHFLTALRSKYLPAIPEHQLSFLPSTEVEISTVPGLHPVTGRWSAFIDPTMGSMFIDESGLEMAPNMDRQAEMLAGFKSIASDDFQRAVARLSISPLDAAMGNHPEQDFPPSADPAVLRSTTNLGNKYKDPISFLVAVMNEPSLAISARIEAAKALLPYFPQGKAE